MLYLVSKDKNVLMVEKNLRKGDPNSGYFTLPGGKLKDEERGLRSLKGRLESAVRETEEETGIRPINPVLRGVILFDNTERVFKNWKNPDNFLVYIFSATNYEGNAKRSEEGTPRTVPLDKIGEVPSNQGDVKMYEWLKDGRNFMGVIAHKKDVLDEENTWVDYF